SRAFLIAYLVLLLLSGFLLSTPGDYWPWYAVTGTCAAVAIVAGPLWHRLIGCACAAMAVGLILWDLQAGAAFHERLARIRNDAMRVSATNGEPGGAANRSQPVGLETNRASAAAGSGR